LLRQVMFAFCLLTMLCLAGTMSLITIVTDRILMKHEAEERLYCEGVSALASFFVDAPLALLGALLNVLIMVRIAGLEQEVFLTVLAWALLLFVVYDSLFAFVGAVARDTRQAQILATPFISVFMLFNGFVISKTDAPAALHWIFDISPNAYAMQSIVVVMADNFVPTTFDGMLEKSQVQEQFPDGSHEQRGLVLMLCMVAVLRTGQLAGLRWLNNVRR